MSFFPRTGELVCSEHRYEPTPTIYLSHIGNRRRMAKENPRTTLCAGERRDRLRHFGG